MKLQSRLVILLLLLALFLSSVATSSMAKEVDEGPKAQEIVDFLEHLNYYDVPKQQQAQLLKKINRGELLDSEKPEMLKLIPEDFFVFDIDQDEKDSFKIFRFPDGSFIAQEINFENSGNKSLNFSNDFSIMSLSSSWDWHNRVIVRKATALIDARFLADIRLTRSSLPSYIDRVYEPSIRCYLGTSCSTTPDELKVIRHADNIITNTPAYAYMKFGSRAPLATRTQYLRFYVLFRNAWHDATW